MYWSDRSLPWLSIVELVTLSAHEADAPRPTSWTVAMAQSPLVRRGLDCPLCRLLVTGGRRGGRGRFFFAALYSYSVDEDSYLGAHNTTALRSVQGTKHCQVASRCSWRPLPLFQHTSNLARLLKWGLIAEPLTYLHHARLHISPIAYRRMKC